MAENAVRVDVRVSVDAGSFVESLQHRADRARGCMIADAERLREMVANFAGPQGSIAHGIAYGLEEIETLMARIAAGAHRLNAARQCAAFLADHVRATADGASGSGE